jgi:hypothetical protein
MENYGYSKYIDFQTMKNFTLPHILQYIFFPLTLIIPLGGNTTLKVGIGKTEIIPQVGTPSAGYIERKGAGMEGVHDPLLAIALFIDNNEKQIILCSVDHLGFTYEMVQAVIQQVQVIPELKNCEIYIGSSHTHSGGGAYLNIPFIGESLAGRYDPDVTKFYVRKTAEAIIQARKSAIPAKIGIGYGKGDNLSKYRGLWPVDINPLNDIAIIKITKLDGSPFAVLFNYPVHPTVLNSQNRLFSSDFVGYARDHLEFLLGDNIQAIYFNGAQGDIIPIILDDEDPFKSCKLLGQSLAETVFTVYHKIETTDSFDIKTQKELYSFKPQPTPFGMSLGLDQYNSEINLIVLNKIHAFITIPGELSSLYDHRLKALGSELGYIHTTIFGLTNDAHGYIILPESWEQKTLESRFSFGGENYGELVYRKAEGLLKNNSIFSK